LSELRTRAIRGVGWTAVQRWTVRATGFLTFVVLSRLLEPAEIGLAALAVAIATSFSVFVDLGTSDYLVRAPDVESRTTSTVFWMQLGLAVALGGPLALFAHPLADAIGTPALAPVLQALTLLLPIYAATAVPAALLHRRLSFAALALRDVLAAVAGAVAGVTLALLGAGVWALVTQSLIQAIVSLIGVLLAARWRPRATFSRRTLSSVVRFGGPLLGVQVMQMVRDRADAFLIGGLLGPAALGIWTVATRLLAIVAEVSTSVLDAVALPVFSRLLGNAGKFREVHRTSVAYTTTLLVPVLVVVAVTSPVLVPLLFGEQWAPSAPLAQILCLAYAIGGLGYLNRAVLVAHGRVGVELALTSSTAVLHVVAVSATAPMGLTAVAWAAVGEALVAVLAGVWALRRAVGIPRPVSWVAVRVLLAGLLGAAAGWAVTAAAGTGLWPDLVLPAVASVGCLAVALLLTNAALVRDIGRDARRLLPARS
jgi:PST family polysaccharide transporter